MFSKNPKFLRNLPAWVWGLITFFILFIGSLVANEKGAIELEKKVNILGVTGIPLFVITIIELINNYRIKTAELVRNHMSAFILNHELYSAFHELIYVYDDNAWDTVKRALDTTILANNQRLNRDEKYKTLEIRESAWNALENINNNHDIGKRFYDPDFFQGSLEEQRLDAVLHYFDVFAYNFNRGLITIDHVTGVLGYHLAVIDSRQVITYYLDRNKKFWKQLPYEIRVGAEPPYENLRKLLLSIREYNMKRTGQQLARTSGTGEYND